MLNSSKTGSGAYICKHCIWLLNWKHYLDSSCFLWVPTFSLVHCRNIYWIKGPILNMSMHSHQCAHIHVWWVDYTYIPILINLWHQAVEFIAMYTYVTRIWWVKDRYLCGLHLLQTDIVLFLVPNMIYKAQTMFIQLMEHNVRDRWACWGS